MAGARQHFLPRFLLRGFQSRISGDRVYTWVQRKAEPSFESNIQNVFVGGKFYEGGQKDVDPDITTLENRFGPVIKRLRQEPASTTLSMSEIPELIVHLSIRTKNIRDCLIDLAKYAFKDSMLYLGNPDNRRAIARREGREYVEHLRKQMGLSKEQLEELVPDLDQRFIEAFENKWQECLNDMESFIEQRLEKTMKDAHTEVLSEGLIPEPGVNLYKNHKWHLIVQQSPSFILGDAGPIHQVGQDFKAFPDKDDLIAKIYLPIGDKHLLAATMGQSIPSVHPEEVNKGQAACAREYIVGSSQTIVERYEKVIGLRGFLLSDEERRKIVQEGLSGL